MKRRVVVTGLGVVTSLSCQVEDLWQRLLAGQSGVHLLRLFETHDFKIKIGGDIYDWNAESYVNARDLKRLDRFTQFAVVAGSDAVAQSGLDFDREERGRCGVIIGSGIGGLTEIEAQMTRLFEKGPDRVSPFVVPKMMINAAGGNLSTRFGLKGPCYTVASACASAANAIGDAYRAIQHNAADIVVTGGTEAPMTRMGLSGFQNMHALSTWSGDPTQASRPFDATREGFVLSEGAGVLVLEDYEHAKTRKADILAEILGFGCSGDAGHITQPDEHGAGAAKAMTDALADGGLRADQVDYINAHGTSTPLGDKAETLAVKTVFGDHARKVSISSTKSALGHSLGASGGVELIIAIKSLAGVVPPTINLHTPDPECDLDYTPNQPKERPIRIAMSNSFGFGGHNASVIVGKLRDM